MESEIHGALLSDRDAGRIRQITNDRARGGGVGGSGWTDGTGAPARKGQRTDDGSRTNAELLGRTAIQAELAGCAPGSPSPWQRSAERTRTGYELRRPSDPGLQQQDVRQSS